MLYCRSFDSEMAMLKKLFLAIIFTILAVITGAGIWFGLWFLSLPKINDLKMADTGLSIDVKDANGKHRDWIVGTKNPSWVPLNQVSPRIINAVVAAEDDAFFQHDGFDFEELKNSIKADLKKKRFARGASTITMQVARNLYLTKGKTISRKLKETYLTYRLENTLTKKRILELYLNIAEWGPGIYGIGQASHYYFGKTPSELDLNEAALLAVILPNPRYFNPYTRMTKVEERQNYLLMRMFAEHDIESEEYETAVSSPVELRERL